MEASTDSGKSPPRKALLIGGFGALALAVVIGSMALRRPTPLPLAREAIDQGNAASAETAFLEHLQQFPDAVDVRLELAVLLKKTDAERALIHFRKLPPTSDHYLTAVRHIAHICLLAKRNDEAEQALRVLAGDIDAEAAIGTFYDTMKDDPQHWLKSQEDLKMLYQKS